MGYTTDFHGSITIDPPCNMEEIEYINRFSSTRRMKRKSGPYTALPGSDGFGQDRSEDILEYNAPPPEQPSLWCHWVVDDTGTRIEWDGGEKFYEAAEWMQYVIDHFLRPAAIAQAELPFLQANHTCNGEIEAQGEEYEDRWLLVVENNRVGTKAGRVVYE